MTGLGRAVCVALGVGALGAVPLLAAQTAAADSAGTSGLARCAAISAPDARLACYDALAARTVPTPAPAAAAVAGATAPVATNPEPPAAAAADIRAFGLTPAQTHTPPPGPAALEAHVVRVHKDQFSHASVELDNGQLWAINGADASLDVGDAVKIERAALGSYLMTTAAKHAYRVTRLR